MIIYDKKLINDPRLVGGKGVGLGKLVKHGLAVPDFFVVTAGTDINDADFAAELDVFAANLHCDLFAVRSSSVSEDGAESSFAGQYSTLLNVAKSGLLDAVKKVAASCDNKTVSDYSQHFGASTGKVAVVVQKQQRGELSGVMFTTSPYNDDEILVESVNGSGEVLVGGVVVPEHKALKKGLQAPSIYGQLIKTAETLENAEGRPLDIEWTYADSKLWLLQMRPLTALGDKLPCIPDRQWNMYVYRDFCLFAHGVQRIATDPKTQTDVFGFSVPIAEGLIVNGREFYSEQNDLQCDKAWRKLDKDDFFATFVKQVKRNVASTRKRADKLKNTDCGALDAKRLFALYSREIKAYVASYVPMMMRPDDYLYGQLAQTAGEERAERLAAAAAVLNKPTYYSQERSKFLSAVVSGDVDGYLDEYEWMVNPLGKSINTLTREKFLLRSANLTPEQAEEKLRQIAVAHQKDCQRRNDVERGLNADERKLFRLISQFIYLRTYTAENSDRYFYYIRTKILANIAKRLGIAEDVLMLMSPEEVKATQNGYRLSAREISKRKSGETVIVTNGKSAVYYTGQSYALLKQLLPASEVNGDVLLTGKVACMGEVTAKVKIVNNIAQAGDFEEGCILVTTMTVPEITSALDKAVGIITDEGGVTCHAAIIAREYVVPCLVGTKNATSVLKDGMLVKLDCINGRVVVQAD